MAALQAQLTATLFCSSSSSTSKSRGGYTCPSPMRTMTMSTPAASRRGSCSVVVPCGTPRAVYSPMSYHQQAFEDAMDEDERMMVEDLLIPSSPAPSAPNHLPYHNTPSSPVASSHFFSPASAIQSQSQVSVTASNPHSHYHALDQSTNQSLFAATDPFYLAQLQASQQPSPSSQSVFAQNGRMSQASRFALSMHAQAAF